jgi:hypothetical protein
MRPRTYARGNAKFCVASRSNLMPRSTLLDIA